MYPTVNQQVAPINTLVQWFEKHTSQRCGVVLLLLVLNLLLVAGGAFKDTSELTLAFNEGVLLEPVFFALLGTLFSIPMLASPLINAVCWLLSQFCPAKRAGVYLAKYHYSLSEPLPALPVHQAHGSRAPPFAI